MKISTIKEIVAKYMGVKNQMIIHNIMDESLAIKLSTKQLEEVLYQNSVITLKAEVDGQITEITIEKAKEWNEPKPRDRRLGKRCHES